MLQKKRHPWIFILDLLIFSAVLILHSTAVLDISIKTASPIVLLPLLTAFSIFHSVPSASVTGFICGAFMDSVSAGSYCFNTVALMLLGAFVSLVADTLFNKNIFAAAVLSLITSALYFLALWGIFHTAGETVQNSIGYLLSYALPSSAYTAVFIFPFFFLYRYFNKLKTQ